VIWRKEKREIAYVFEAAGLVEGVDCFERLLDGSVIVWCVKKEGLDLVYSICLACMHK
jgi:hypothetical protein